ncbi:MAG: OmpH family outer membrane protein [Gammaproteobacteria bacterium]
MRIPNLLSVITACFLIGSQSVAVAETKIGYVDAVKLMNEAPQTKTIQKKIESEFEPRRKKLVSLQKNLREMEDKLSRDTAVMSEDEASKLKRDILAKRRDMKRISDEFQDDLNLRQNEILAKFQKQVYEAIESLAKEKGYDLILGQGVIYASDAVDVTTQVMQKLK